MSRDDTTAAGTVTEQALAWLLGDDTEDDATGTVAVLIPTQAEPVETIGGPRFPECIYVDPVFGLGCDEPVDDENTELCLEHAGAFDDVDDAGDRSWALRTGR